MPNNPVDYSGDKERTRGYSQTVPCPCGKVFVIFPDNKTIKSFIHIFTATTNPIHYIL